jgi:hypothetical protein
MGDDIAQSPGITKRPGRKVGVRVGLFGLLAGFGVLVAACGVGSMNPGAANTRNPTTTTVAPSGAGSNSSGDTSQSEELQFAQCVRSHGVPNFPDPSGGGLLNAISAAGINTKSPTYLSAEQACKRYSPAGHLSPAQSAVANAQGLEFSQCMRSHGVPNFPDPSAGPTGGQAINLHGLGIDPSSPTFQAANSACQNIVPGSK